MSLTKSHKICSVLLGTLLACQATSGAKPPPKLALDLNAFDASKRTISLSNG